MKKDISTLFPILVAGIIFISLIIVIGIFTFRKSLTPSQVLAQAGCTCTARSSAEGISPTVTCDADEILITGGCFGTTAGSYPVDNGWMCPSLGPVIAHAWCCK